MLPAVLPIPGLFGGSFRDMSAPLNNQNRVTHGLRMPLSQLPKGCHYIDVAVNELRNSLEILVLDVCGTLGTYQRLVVQSACRYEKHAQLTARWLRMSDDDLSHSDRLAYSREVARASAERDKCLQRLGLDKSDTASVWDSLYEKPQDAVSRALAADDSEHVTAPPDAQASRVEATTGNDGGATDAR